MRGEEEEEEGRRKGRGGEERSGVEGGRGAEEEKAKGKEKERRRSFHTRSRRPAQKHPSKRIEKNVKSGKYSEEDLTLCTH